ncbi:MAG: ParB N-terminal domain-containing protein, partial [Rubrobacter sp.]|nr:ParB N-terminal domain-containing protein [Rubrobacter sp.]
MRESIRSLRLVETERLLLHETRESARLAALRESIAAEGVQSHPVIAAPHGADYLVLDGAHRVGALAALGCRMALVQAVEPPGRAESWPHVLES